MNDLFELAGEKFYLDIHALSDFIKINEEKSIDELLNKKIKKTEEEEDNLDEKIEYYNGPLIDMAKWEVVKAMIETVLNENGIIDESMGFKKLENQLSIPFRLSFNTLLKNKLILKK